MAFDGITIANIVSELNHTIVGGKINKIAQPEADELMITVKNNRTQYRLFLSASASLPLIYLTGENKQGPLTAPNFCMLLRKHIGSARILSVTQPGLERILIFELEHLNELGDICRKKLIVEIMGKHSNIIFCQEDDTIIDSIKHISANMSSVREVLPGRTWFIPHTQDKMDPLSMSREAFTETVFGKNLPVFKAIYTSLTGFSPLIAEELCVRSGIDPKRQAQELEETEKETLWQTTDDLVDRIRRQDFSPVIVYQEEEPLEFAAFPLTKYQDQKSVSYESISQVLESYYSMKNKITLIRQKSADLRRIVTTAIERTSKKYELQQKQQKDTERKEKYRIYGELLNTYGYHLEEGARSLEALNYYTNEMITIPLDEHLSAAENAKKYFDRYTKLKRTEEALNELLEETRSDLEHLESIRTSLDIALDEDDLVEVREELMEYGYLRRKGSSGKKKKIVSRPFHYRSSDGFDIYVGKNNFQNDELSFKIASGNDWWFHAKGQPGSHVIVKSNGEELPDRTFEEAARLAAFYSKGRQAPKVEIDYTQKKNLKKPNGAKPGFVIYHTNYSMIAEPKIHEIEEIK
ncbi:MAG: NFACT family protein [Lachnospiraceae bacterium]|nr:NFACT family protein [Lachnospiraceae bacterium]